MPAAFGTSPNRWSSSRGTVLQAAASVTSCGSISLSALDCRIAAVVRLGPTPQSQIWHVPLVDLVPLRSQISQLTAVQM